MKAINLILAQGLMAQANAAQNLALVIEANPRIAEIMADPEEPAVSLSQVEEYLKNTYPKRTLVDFRLELDCNLSWAVKYTYEQKYYYRSEEEAGRTWDRKEEATDDHQIAAAVTFTDSFSYSSLMLHQIL